MNIKQSYASVFKTAIELAETKNESNKTLIKNILNKRKRRRFTSLFE